MQTTKPKLTKVITVLFAFLLLAGYVVYSQRYRTIGMISGTKSNACINNLRQIDGAKQQWAIENKKSPSDVPTTNDISPYLKQWPVCPQGGNLTIDAVSNNPACSVAGHRLP